MTVFADVSVAVEGTFHVLSGGDGFEVFGVPTHLVATKVVDDKLVGYLTNQSFVSKSMDLFRNSFSFFVGENHLPVRVSSPRPLEATSVGDFGIANESFQNRSIVAGCISHVLMVAHKHD